MSIPAVQRARLAYLALQLRDGARALVHDVRAHRVESPGERLDVGELADEPALDPVVADSRQHERLHFLERAQPGHDAVGADVEVPTVRPYQPDDLVAIPTREKPDLVRSGAVILQREEEVETAGEKRVLDGCHELVATLHSYRDARCGPLIPAFVRANERLRGVA
jgi:hypothetical protein